jgi:acyl-CoA reductase-like NAD-dependent aldehyde dehydrogenase
VHEDIKAEFTERLVARVKTLRVGDPTSADTEMGPLILPKELLRVGSWVGEAGEAGGKILTGGTPVSEHVFSPTVIDEPPSTAKVSQLEIFGPVTCIYGYAKLDEAIMRANSLSVAFQAAVFSQDIDVALHAAKRLDASAVMINDHTAFRVDWMPFAGRQQSGYGVGGIPYTMHDMTSEKMIVLKMRD